MFPGPSVIFKNNNIGHKEWRKNFWPEKMPERFPATAPMQENCPGESEDFGNGQCSILKANGWKNGQNIG